MVMRSAAAAVAATVRGMAARLSGLMYSLAGPGVRVRSGDQLSSALCAPFAVLSSLPLNLLLASRHTRSARKADLVVL